MLKGNVKVSCDECGKVLEEFEDTVPEDVGYEDTSESDYITLGDGTLISCMGKTYEVGYADNKHFCNETCLASALKKFFSSAPAKEVKKSGNKKGK